MLACRSFTGQRLNFARRRFYQCRFALTICAKQTQPGSRGQTQIDLVQDRRCTITESRVFQHQERQDIFSLQGMVN
jgi:hypothetical protein